MHRKLQHQRGVSLVEALVAFAIMAFGMLAVVGMQGTLRTNGDLARQRAEAVRIAQDAVETWRAFTTLATTASRTAYADVATVTDPPITGTNATYTVTRRADNPTAVSGTVTPGLRTLVVDVTWQDRTNQTQMVRLGTTLAGVEPELSASVVLAANPDPVLTPGARNRAVPPGAVALPGVGRSGFVPPGQTGSGPRVAWVFNNADGVITICSTNATSSAGLLFDSGAPTCGTQKALLLTGVVRFGTGLDPSSSTSALANPSGTPVEFGLRVARFAEPDEDDEDGSTQVTCFLGDVVDTQRPYYCAVPITSDVPKWGGRIEFTEPLELADGNSSDEPDEYRVCRYHAAARYFNVTASLLNQNFVLIQAGNGTTRYTCPSTSVPQVWQHQPRT
jgi:Tfp pilus assembly protein PilV